MTEDEGNSNTRQQKKEKNFYPIQIKQRTQKKFVIQQKFFSCSYSKNI